MKYSIAKDFIVRDIVDECLIVRISNPDEEENTFYALNPTGKEIIDCITKGMTFDEIIDNFCESFDVERSVAQEDIKEFIDSFVKLNVLEEIN